MTAETTLSIDLRGEVAHLLIDGAPHNRLTFAFYDQLREVLEVKLPSLAPLGLVISGRGHHFSSGADLDELFCNLGDGNESSPSWCENNRSLFHRLTLLPFPVVAAISGCCLGSGLELALSCAFRIAAENALMALPEAQHGLIPGCGGTVLLTEIIGFRRAMTFALSGEPVSAPEAFALGLVDWVVPRKNLLESAERLVYCMADRSL